MNDPSLSIIIVNYRAWQHLQACLDSLLDNNHQPPGDWQVVVVDNDSDDGELAGFQVNYPWVEWLLNSGNNGFAHGCNLGAKAARGEQLLFLNPDTVDPGGQLHRYLDIKQSNPGIQILSVNQTDQHGRPQKVFDVFPTAANLFGPIRSLQRKRINNIERDDPAQPLEVPWVSGSVLMIARKDFDRIGGWCDEFWMYSEDVDLCRRATDHDMAVAVTDQARIIHHHGGASRRNPETTARSKAEVIMSRHLYTSRHMTGFSQPLMHFMLILMRVVPKLLLLPLAALSGRNNTTGLILKHLLTYYRGAFRNGDWRSPRSISRSPSADQVPLDQS